MSKTPHTGWLPSEKMLSEAKVLTINSYYLPEKSRFSLAKIVVDVLTIVLEPVCSAGSNQNLWTVQP